MIGRLANQPIDRHAVGDRPQPAGKRLRLAELADFLHRLNEDVLAQLLRLAKVAQPAQGDRHDVPLEALEQLAESLPVAALRSPDQSDQLHLVSIKRQSRHGMSPKKRV